jgi:hypothetical protein
MLKVYVVSWEERTGEASCNVGVTFSVEEGKNLAREHANGWGKEGEYIQWTDKDIYGNPRGYPLGSDIDYTIEEFEIETESKWRF